MDKISGMERKIRFVFIFLVALPLIDGADFFGMMAGPIGGVVQQQAEQFAGQLPLGKMAFAQLAGHIDAGKPKSDSSSTPAASHAMSADPLGDQDIFDACFEDSLLLDPVLISKPSSASRGLSSATESTSPTSAAALHHSGHDADSSPASSNHPASPHPNSAPQHSTHGVDASSSHSNSDGSTNSTLLHTSDAHTHSISSLAAGTAGHSHSSATNSQLSPNSEALQFCVTSLVSKHSAVHPAAHGAALHTTPHPTHSGAHPTTKSHALEFCEAKLLKEQESNASAHHPDDGKAAQKNKSIIYDYCYSKISEQKLSHKSAHSSAHTSAHSPTQPLQKCDHWFTSKGFSCKFQNAWRIVKNATKSRKQIRRAAKSVKRAAKSVKKAFKAVTGQNSPTKKKNSSSKKNASPASEKKSPTEGKMTPVEEEQSKTEEEKSPSLAGSTHELISVK